MSRVNLEFKVQLRLDEIEEQILSAFESADPISGVGPDGDSQYSIEVTSVERTPLDEFKVTMTCLRDEGKFAAGDELAEEVISSVETYPLEVPMEVEW